MLGLEEDEIRIKEESKVECKNYSCCLYPKKLKNNDVVNKSMFYLKILKSKLHLGRRIGKCCNTSS